jgi:LysM repeat protein
MRNFDFCRGTVHVIRRGDSLYTISKRYNVPLALIMRANPYVDVYNLQVGDEICVPTTNMGGIGNIGTGNRPSAPVRPNMPEQPTRPMTPNMPEQQTRPMMPSMPEQQTRPMMPSMPEQETRPMTPNMPEQQTRPMTPSMPEQQTRPMTPNMPEQPTRPMTPNMQGNTSMNLITYIVKDAESLKDILDKFDIDLEDFIEQNNMSTVLLKPGMTINIPDRRLREEEQ